MFTQFFKKTLFSRIISFVATVSFVLSNVPVGYANSNMLRPMATKKNPGIMYELEHAAMRSFLERVNARDKKYTVRTVEDVDGDIYIQAVPGMAEEMFKETGRHFKGHYAIRPDKNGISYIYIDKDTFYGENGEGYVEHEMDELIGIRVFAKDKGWTFDELVRWLDQTGEPEEIERVLAQIHDEAAELPEEAVEIVSDIPPRVMLAEAIRRPVRGAAASGQTSAMDLVTMTMDELKAQIQQKGIASGFIALDWNVSKVDKTEDLERINKSVPTITKIFNETGIRYLYGFTHRGRPKGTGFEDDAKLKLRPVIDKAGDFLKGLDIEIVALSYDLEKAKQEIAEAKEKYKGKKIFFIFENIRFYPEEQEPKDVKVREEFEKKLIALTGQNAEQLVYFSEAFDKAHRGAEASMELVKMIPKENRAAGMALEQDLNAVIAFLKGMTGTLTVLFGGAKFDKFANIATISEKTIKQRGGVLLIAGAQANPWEKLANNKGVGTSLLPTDKEMEEVQAAVEKIKASGIKVLSPVDYVVKVRDNKLAEPQKALAIDMSQVDIGPETIALFRQRIRSLKAGDGLILNGGTGMFDNGFPEGTFAIIEEAEAAAERGVSVLFAGGDMDKAAREYERARNRKLNPKIKRTTGGGVVWTIIAKNVVADPTTMPAIEAVLKTAAPAAVKTTPELPTPGVGIPGVGPAAVEPIFPNKIPLGGKLTVGGNWKLRKDITTEAEAWAKVGEFTARFAGVDENAEIVLFVQDKWMKAISEALQGSNIAVGVQSFHFDPLGNIEQQIEDAVNNGAKYAMVGHSMHRYPDPKVLPGIAALTNEEANKIVKAILKDGRLKLWYIIGIDEDTNKSLLDNEEYIKKQITDGIEIGLDGVTERQVSNIIMTAEPIHDISTKTGDGWIDPKTRVNFPKVEMLAKYLTEALSKKFGRAAEVVNTGYGASASPETAATLLSHPNVFNILPGGKSLEANDFYGTVVNAIIGKYGSHGIAQELNVGEDVCRGFATGDRTIHNAQGGQALGTFTDDVLKYLQTLSPEALKNMKTPVIIVDPNFFRAGGVKSALETVAKLSKVVRIALYGKDADNIRILVGNKDIITAKDIETLYTDLLKMGLGNAIVLRSQDELPDNVKLVLQTAGDAQIVSSQLPTLAIAKALKELLNVKKIDDAFEKFLGQIKTDNVISEQAYNSNRAELLAKLKEGQIFEFSPDLKPAPAVTEKTEVEAARKQCEEFLTKIGI